MKIALGFLLAFTIGFACRLTGVPLPAPTALMGALLIVAMTVGYVLTDRLAMKKNATHGADSGGPTGAPLDSSSKVP